MNWKLRENYDRKQGAGSGARARIRAGARRIEGGQEEMSLDWGELPIFRPRLFKVKNASQQILNRYSREGRFFCARKLEVLSPKFERNP